MEERNLRKVMIGTVVSDKMDKTVVVAVETTINVTVLAAEDYESNSVVI